MANPELIKQVREAWEMSDEELYKRLGLASLGTRSFAESTVSMQLLLSSAGDTNAAHATRVLCDDLLEKGRIYFAWLWNNLKNFVCIIHGDGNAIGEGRDLVAYIAGILIAAGKISNPIAVLVITIAVRKGLDELCREKESFSLS
jgi:hypothetical protein